MQQRWPLAAAAAVAGLGLLLGHRAQGLAAVLAPLGIATSGAIAVFHSGVERKWWQGPPCASSVDPNLPPAEYMKAIEQAALVNCHDIPWSLFGLSMANYNALISLSAGAFLLVYALAAIRKGQRGGTAYASSSVSQ
ncbi:MAG: disulfide bond formation protein B [Pseudomonadota bacterium]